LAKAIVIKTITRWLKPTAINEKINLKTMAKLIATSFNGCYLLGFVINRRWLQPTLNYLVLSLIAVGFSQRLNLSQKRL
jgi:hypothetical protein